MNKIEVSGITLGGTHLVLIAGPCVIEDYASTGWLAERLKEITDSLDMPFIFKASYDKANRTSINTYRGPGIEKGLEILKEIKERFKIPVLTDVHCRTEVERVAEVVDILQIPAYLSRQTALITSAAKTNKVVNIKKGQFLAPWDIKGVIDKVLSTKNDKIIISERGTMFGYNNLVVDMRGIPIIRAMGYPVVFDATHSVQLPGGLGEASSGERDMVPFLARGAVAVGIDGIFLEVHREPENALCDGPNSLAVSNLKGLLSQLKQINSYVKRGNIRM